MLRLTIRDSSGERVFSTDRSEILVGSREGADLRLSDPAAAPNHCILRAEGDRLRLIALSAAGANGGRRSAEALLAPGSEFTVGSTVLRVVSCAGAPLLEIEEPWAPPAAPAAPPPPPVPPPESDFAREVRATVAKAPWYLISLVVHVFLLMFLNLISLPRENVDLSTRMAGVVPKDAPEPEVLPETPLDLSQIERDMESEAEIDINEPLSAAVRKDPADVEISEFKDIVPPDRLGLAGGRRPMRRLDKPLPFSKVKGGDETLDKGDIEGEQGRATDEVKRGLGDGIRAARQRLKDEHIIVVQGNYDKIEEILHSYSWPFTLVTREELLSRPHPRARILFVNCGNRPPAAQAARLADLTKRFLEGGCWVVTSDWSVDPYLTNSFPLLVHVANKERSQRDTTVAVEPVGEDPLLEGVFPRGDSTWWLEDMSTMVAVSDRVTTLVASDDMQRRYGSRVVAFKFSYGKGQVLHLVGHFYQKDGNRRGLVAMHRLINNVILARVAADEKR